MKIEKYISDLLYRYQCVIVPTLGAFLTEFQSANLDSKMGTFNPPTKRLSFNANINSNDGLLANHIAKEQSISYDQALELILTSVEDYKEALKYGKISLEDIGEFENNIEGRLVFHPFIKSNFLKTSFGLTSIEVKNITRNQTINNIATPIATVKKASGKQLFLRYAASVVVLVGIGTIIFQNGYDSMIEKQNLEVKKAVQTQVQDKIQQATFLIEPTVTSISLPVREVINTTEKLPYYIIANAFRNKDAAIQEAEKLQIQGYRGATALGRTKYGMYPVSYGGFQNQIDAQEELRKIHRTLNSDAWILLQ